MNNKKSRKFTRLGFVVAMLFWLVESVIHRYIFHEATFELIPSEPNEIWMRSLVFFLIIGLGLYADSQTSKIIAKERQKRDVYLATVGSTQHILNNLMNQMQLCLYDEAGLDEKTRELLRQSLHEGKEQVARLSSVSELDHDTIRQSVLPPQPDAKQ